MAHGHRGLVEKEAVTQPTVHFKAARTVVCHMALPKQCPAKGKTESTVRRWDITSNVSFSRENQSNNR